MPYSNIDKGSKYFNTVLYTGTGATRSITGAGFKPDWVWIKERSASASAHNLSDAVRGAGKALFSNTTDAEYDYGTGTGGNLRSFDSDGFSLGTATQTNDNGTTFVSWNWLGANTTVSNTSGSITSTVSVNTTAGFSIVSYTGTGSNATVGHGLGVAPDFLIIKNRTGSNSWPVWSRSYGNTGVMFLDLQNTPPDTNSVFLNGTSPTSSVFSIGTAGHVNTSASNYIAYVFNSVKGYSKFGSYTGNGSTDGTFIYTGFKPKFFLAKRSDTNNSWTITNSNNQSYNQADTFLLADSSQAESTATSVDYLSNGVKIRSTGAWGNASGGTYIYMAFAENPFTSSKGIACTAR
jgi:hypothetical protein